ncbi:MAG: hypothetical protein SXA11_06610 [Cyanobacteriota bacterium]|nr:hypothetical protein [Cyanobacteriota bacterium]
MAVVPESIEFRENLRYSVLRLFDAVDSYRRQLHDYGMPLSTDYYRFEEEIDRIYNEVKHDRQALQDYFAEDDEEEDDCED